ncbi:transporter substrate-binding domain-containing protein [Pseudidiomarina sp.]|uniref:transporter substrate-binding domain-containing protein n=1 Tax=Pseudidiomarina sp. TaxID=2081707 RepID=UPI00299EAC97|nr:transporter substrate-binding domain-containing protein [Pseudidiomarina sp.]MDX1705891.1 transporter substrate-binding domain-containing protein [Pseudidiomarina sp.]
MKLWNWTVGLTVATLLSLSPASAQDQPQAESQAQPGEALQVAVRVSPPFVMKNEQGEYSGLTIRLWERIAEQNGYDYEYQETGLTELLDGVEQQRFHIGLGAISVTADRESQIDFTQPFYNAGLGIAIPDKTGSSWWYVMQRFISIEFLSVLLALFAILLLAGWALWLFERRHNQDEFSPYASRGIGAGFWWAAVTMTTVGYGDKSPRTLAGRVVAFIWMFTSVIIISSFTASIASSLTVGQLASQVESQDDLVNVRVSSVPGSYSAAWLERRNIGYQKYENLEAALASVDRGEADAAVYDAPLLKYLLRQQNVELTTLPATFAPQDYAIVMQQGDKRREQINLALLRHTRTAEWRELVSDYLGDSL